MMKNITADRLILSEDMLASEGIIQYFSTGANEAQKEHITMVLKFVRSHVGGYIYPLMWLAEQSVSSIIQTGATAEAAIARIASSEFHENVKYTEMCRRIVPDVDVQVYPEREISTKARAINNDHNVVISQQQFRPFGYKSL